MDLNPEPKQTTIKIISVNVICPECNQPIFGEEPLDEELYAFCIKNERSFSGDDTGLCSYCGVYVRMPVEDPFGRTDGTTDVKV